MTRLRLCLAALLAFTALALASASSADAFVYWANHDTSSIGRANNDGSGVNQTLVTGYVDHGLPSVLITVFTVCLFAGLWFALPLARREKEKR